jgi:hypothetical protein
MKTLLVQFLPVTEKKVALLGKDTYGALVE